MVNAVETLPAGAEARAAERRLILSYAPPAARAGLAALLDLDDELAAVLARVTEPMIAQMRLTWWHDALSALDRAPPPAQPVLVALAHEVLPRGILGGELARLIEGWEALLEGEANDREVRAAFAEGRGARLFVLAARLCGGEDARVEAVGRGWALAGLTRTTDAVSEARATLDAALAGRWPRSLRALSALAHRARMDLATPPATPPPAATPGRVARLAWHRLTGR